MMGEPAVADGVATHGEESPEEALEMLRSALNIIDRHGLSADCGALLQEVIERLESQSHSAWRNPCSTRADCSSGYNCTKSDSKTHNCSRQSVTWGFASKLQKQCRCDANHHRNEASKKSCARHQAPHEIVRAPFTYLRPTALATWKGRWTHG